MKPEIVTLIVGLAGIIATLISSSLGLYFIAKARSSALRESLFTQQLDLVKKIVFKQGRVRVYFTVLMDKGGPFEEQAREDAGESVRDFSEFQEEGAAILPVELWVEVKQLNDVMTDILVSYDDAGEITRDHMKSLVAHATKVGLLSRAVLGIDELTTESLKLYTSEKSFKRLADLEVEHFEKIYDQTNT